MNALRKKVIEGMGWRGFVDASQLVLQIIFTAILARLLGLADFGLAAMSMVFLRFVRALTDVGFGAAVIQDQKITQGQISAIFVIQFLIKTGVFTICVLAAPLAAAFFEQPALVDLIRVLALVILFDSVAFPQTLARKQLQFKGYSLLELAAMMASNVVGIAMALAGFGVWSLIGRVLVQRGVFAIGIWPIVGWRPVRPEFRGVGRYVRFGFTMFASTTIYFFSQHLATIIIGKFIGVETLGLYNVAYNLAIVPAQKIQSTLTTVLMPAFATLQKSPNAMRRNVHASLFSVAIVFVPLMLGLAAVAPNFVTTVYGVKWAPAGGFLVVLALVGLLKGLEHVLRSVLVASGRPRTILAVTAIETVVSVPLLWAAGKYLDIWGVIFAYLFVSAIAFPLTGLFVQRRLGDAWLIARAIWRSLTAGVAMFSIVYLVPDIIDLTKITVLGIQVAVGIILYSILRWLMLSPVERGIVRTWPVFGRILR